MKGINGRVRDSGMEEGLSSIRDNIYRIRERIAAAAGRAGRNADDIALVCVTKTRTPEEISEVLRAGEFELGENRVQEFLEKYDKVQYIADDLGIKRNIKWNLIGHLQRNKVKYIAGKMALIHSVDSFKLAEEINTRASRTGEPSEVLIQLNPAGEIQKSGAALSECEALAGEIEGRLPYVRLRGLMAVVPFADDPEDVRGYYRDVKNLFDKLAGKYMDKGRPFDKLSMGMTNDFEVAIEEGATIVRVGTAIFGPRRERTEDVV